MSGRRLEGLLTRGTLVLPHERRAVLLAFSCNFLLLGSYYILKPVRDTVATVFGADQLQLLFTGTFIGTLIASPIYSWLAVRVRLNRLLPGVFWFWVLNVLLFQVLFKLAPDNRWIGGAYYVWFSAVNLFMISVFWTLMVDLFSASQATRLFALIAAGGSARRDRRARSRCASGGAGCGPGRPAAHCRRRVRGGHRPGAPADAGEGQRLRAAGEGGQLDDPRPRSGRQRARWLPGTAALALFAAAGRVHAADDLGQYRWLFPADRCDLQGIFRAVASRAVAIADISLVVNVLAAIILLFGLGRYVHRFGVTAGLILNPLIMVVAFIALALSPTLLMIQALQVIRQVSQYAIARPSREICFTVVPQSDRYKTKNVIDTVVYRFGDLSAAWMETGLRLAGLRVIGSAVAGLGLSVIWGMSALLLGKRYEILKAKQEAAQHSAVPPQPAQV